MAGRLVVLGRHHELINLYPVIEDEQQRAA